MLGKAKSLDKWRTPGSNNYNIRYNSLESTGGQTSREPRMKSKIDFHKIAVGPGSYEGNTPAITSFKPHYPQFSISKAKRNDLILAQVVKSPGPGT